MKCILCTVCSLFFAILVIFKFAFFASIVYPIIEEPKQIEHEYQVIIMGAGISGIVAATELFNAGIKNILIIEAQDYIGGRIKTIEFGINKKHNTYTLNIGASHIYGISQNKSNNNPIYKLLNKYNIKYKIDNNIIHSMPFPNHDHLLLKSYNKQLKNIEKLHNMCDDNSLFISDPLGLQGILLHLAANLIENGINIILNEPIQTIQHNANKIIIKTHGTQGNNIYQSKFAINTFSYGVLQNNSTTFQPNLPSWKYEAIFQHEMVQYNTIYIQWPYIFWNNEIYDNIINTNEFIISINNLNDNKYFSGSNIWKIDIITNRSIEENIYKFIENNLKIYFEYELPKPLDIFISDWNNNKFIGGIWSVYKYNNNNEIILNDNDHWKRIKSRVNNIFFASDGTINNKQFIGTITGGYLEGIRCANEILACLKSQLNWKCPRQYFETNKNDMFINILTKFTDDYRIYFLCWLQFVVIRLFILILMCILIIRKLLKYCLKDSL